MRKNKRYNFEVLKEEILKKDWRIFRVQRARYSDNKKEKPTIEYIVVQRGHIDPKRHNEVWDYRHIMTFPDNKDILKVIAETLLRI